LYLLTCRSDMRLPGTVATFLSKAITVGTQPQTHPGGVRQPLKIVVAERSR